MKSKCKSLRIAERHLRRRRQPHRLSKPLLFTVVSEQRPRILQLRNGDLLRQAIPGVRLYLSITGRVYSLTRYGLRQRRVNFWKKHTYCKPLTTGRGHHQGESYPNVSDRNKRYAMHQLMAEAWCGGLSEGFVADHINGDIDDFSERNIRVITVEENIRCGGVLRRLRRASVLYDCPQLHPMNMDQPELLDLFERLKPYSGKALEEAIRQEAMRLKEIANEQDTPE